MAEEREFKGVWIPKEIWLDTRLNMLDKGILTEIDSLDNEKGCTASNKYLSEFCQCSETKVSTAISKLIELEYIYVESFDGRTRVLKSRLSNFKRQTLNILKADIKNFKTINKDNNIIDYKYIVDYLNSKAKTNYRYQTPKTQSLIRARINEGFTQDDFKVVIDKKCSEWINTDMAQYLRPETLFGNKFESYLNANIKIKSNKQATKREYTKEEFDNLFDNIDEINI